MDDDNCTLFNCIIPFHDHDEREALPPAASLVDTEDPAFPTVARLLTDMRDAGISLTPDAVRTAVALGRHYHGRDAADLPMPATRANEIGAPLVYYIRMGNLIKIGTTRHMRKRMIDLRPDEILAVEPGSYDQERARHIQFARYRSRGEYFLPVEPLMTHIAQLREKHGKTPSTVSIARHPRSVVADR